MLFLYFYIIKWATTSDVLDTQPGAFINATTIQPGSMFNFPITLTGIMIKLDAERESGVVYRDSLVIDNLRVSYPDITTDILGREVATLVSQKQTPGNYTVEFDGSKLTS